MDPIVSEIDDLLTCQFEGCTEPSEAGVFCGPDHQRRWHGQFVEPLENPWADASRVTPGFDEARWTPEGEQSPSWTVEGPEPYRLRNGVNYRAAVEALLSNLPERSENYSQHVLQSHPGDPSAVDVGVDAGRYDLCAYAMPRLFVDRDIPQRQRRAIYTYLTHGLTEREEQESHDGGQTWDTVHITVRDDNDRD